MAQKIGLCAHKDNWALATAILRSAKATLKADAGPMIGALNASPLTMITSCNHCEWRALRPIAMKVTRTAAESTVPKCRLQPGHSEVADDRYILNKDVLRELRRMPSWPADARLCKNRDSRRQVWIRLCNGVAAYTTMGNMKAGLVHQRTVGGRVRWYGVRQYAYTARFMNGVKAAMLLTPIAGSLTPARV